MHRVHPARVQRPSLHLAALGLAFALASCAHAPLERTSSAGDVLSAPAGPTRGARADSIAGAESRIDDLPGQQDEPAEDWSAMEHVRAVSITHVWIVRHAEALQDGTRDPALSPAGQARARLLPGVLRGRNISAIFATPYRRTQETAAPLADSLHLEITTYDPRDSTGLASKIMSENLAYEVLVVGHSNTVPGIIAALGGERPPDLEHSEYDALFEVEIYSESGGGSPDSTAATVRRTRYGAPGGTNTTR